LQWIFCNAEEVKVRILLVGLGSIGRRHLANLSSLIPGADIAILRRKASVDEPTVAAVPLGCRVVYDLYDAIRWRPTAALICSPTVFHLAQALQLAEHGVHLFIEKPLSHSLEGVDRLLRLTETGTVVLVGYNLRFLPALQALQREVSTGRIGKLLSIRAEVGQYLPDWRPTQDYRNGVSAQKKLGGGVLLELSHELDLACWLGGEIRSVSAQVERLSNLDIDVADTAEIVLRFTSGAMGSIHLDMIQRHPTRCCKLIGSEGTLIWDAAEDNLQWFDASKRQWSAVWQKPAPDRNTMYRSELQHFFDCIEGRAFPAVDGRQGKRVLELAMAAMESSASGKVIAV
jgi:predicted dehydrogenase